MLNKMHTSKCSKNLLKQFPAGCGPLSKALLKHFLISATFPTNCSKLLFFRTKFVDIHKKRRFVVQTYLIL